ncbi:uncharacterized protein LOC113549216 [Rhopalosiphum maidis]|uniref:uncharacterized protein LOC113549216 n=1 Tax=Rhopalosiphum maidis TaxID=43146 RepID=UPI000EFE6DCE|nr:uncharacterized protein LOC113549216 [Rhopalosiphum maidis]XP_026806211.1 uncharacterized protein LOC113549216 [Rhopalosiphum maidis]XP_026806212.1 uncharacterized protein LOC113549216 [Rhopalosiphum maidis]XP_026806213.1 uncharacterized protein LOC113549216 [Rhopalosiphum maidis]
MFENKLITVLYILTIIVFICWFCLQLGSLEPNSNQIQTDNSIDNSDLQQSDSVPLNTVLNDLDYENIYNDYNALHTPPRQTNNAAQASRINVSTPQATIVPLSSSLNYAELNTFNFAPFSRSPLDDPPPSYDETTRAW